MKNKGRLSIFHPFVCRWMKEFSLVSDDTCTEVGYTAKPKLDRFPADFYFTFDDIEGDIERLNSIYGTSFDRVFLEDSLPGYASLNKLARQSREIREEPDILRRIGIESEDRGVYIGGLRLPGRDIFYVESNRLIEGWKARYNESKTSPELLSCVSFIPVSGKYFPRF